MLTQASISDLSSRVLTLQLKLPLVKTIIGVTFKFAQQAKNTYITNKAQTKQVRKAKKAANKTNNLKVKASLKQDYHGRQQILQRSNRGQ